MTKLSAENPGAFNYTIKRDWRRVADQEWRREGQVYFAPAESGTVGTQPFPNYPDTDEPITLLHQLRSANGKTAVVAGTPTTLFRYFTEPGGVYELDVFEEGVYATVGEGEWIVIGTGYSQLGHRWEAVNVAGIAVFNNGVNLPVTYAVDEFEVTPMYELREQGIVAVETIAEFYGALFAADVTELNTEDIGGVMAGADPYGILPGTVARQRYSFRVIWSMIKTIDRWGATFDGDITAGSSSLVLDYRPMSLNIGDEIIVVGAGTNGGNHTTTITGISGSVFTLAAPAITTVVDAVVSKSDLLSIIAGYSDLQDDSSTVIRMIALQGRLVVLKDTAYFIGSYTGDSANPFTFQRTYTGSQTIYWRWTLTVVDGEYLLFAGRFNFLTFSLTSLTPTEHPKFLMCDNLFYSVAIEENDDLIFSADNGLTNEIFFCFPSPLGDDRALIYDYQYGTVSTTGRHFTAAVTIKKPGKGIQVGPQQDWFIIGKMDGTVLQYALTAFGFTGYQLEGEEGYDYEGYSSVLQSGWISFEDDHNEKDLRSHVTILSSHSPGTQFRLEIESTANPGDAADLVVDEQIEDPHVENLTSVFARNNYFRDRITVTGPSDVKLSARVWEIYAIRSVSHIRGKGE